MNSNREKWRPSNRFLRRGHSLFKHSDLETEVEWQFSRIKTPFTYPTCVARCEMVAFDLSAEGFGDHADYKVAAIKAFAEAWERIWLEICQADSSNGFAAGHSNEHAIESAQNELIERATLLRAWAQQKGWKKYDPKHCLDRRINCLRRQGWNVEFYEIETKYSWRTVCILARHPVLGAIFDTSCTRENSRVSVDRLLDSALRATVIRGRAANPLGRATYLLPELGIPSDHRRFYEVPTHLEAFHFLDQLNSESERIDLEELSEVQPVLLVPVTDFPAVARATHPSWPRLEWGRKSIGGINPFPHPLA